MLWLSLAGWKDIGLDAIIDAIFDDTLSYWFIRPEGEENRNFKDLGGSWSLLVASDWKMRVECLISLFSGQITSIIAWSWCNLWIIDLTFDDFQSKGSDKNKSEKETFYFWRRRWTQMEVEKLWRVFWTRDWRENSWKLFGEGWAGRWTDITLSPWTQNTFYLIVSGLTNAFLMPLTPLLYRYLTVLWQSSSCSKEKLGILLVGWGGEGEGGGHKKWLFIKHINYVTNTIYLTLTSQSSL